MWATLRYPVCFGLCEYNPNGKPFRTMNLTDSEVQSQKATHEQHRCARLIEHCRYAFFIFSVPMTKWNYCAQGLSAPVSLARRITSRVIAGTT